MVTANTDCNDKWLPQTLTERNEQNNMLGKKNQAKQKWPLKSEGMSYYYIAASIVVLSTTVLRG